MAEEDQFVKCIFLGRAASGKTSIIKKYTSNTEPSNQYRRTIGVDFSNKSITINFKPTVLQLWDITGGERFQPVTRVFYKGSRAVFLVYDITDRASFEMVKQYFEFLIKNLPASEAVYCLIGNKGDLAAEREVSIEEAKEMAKERGIINGGDISCFGDSTKLQDLVTTTIRSKSNLIFLTIQKCFKLKRMIPKIRVQVYRN